MSINGAVPNLDISCLSVTDSVATLALYSFDRQMNLCAKALGLAVPL